MRFQSETGGNSEIGSLEEVRAKLSGIQENLKQIHESIDPNAMKAISSNWERLMQPISRELRILGGPHGTVDSRQKNLDSISDNTSRFYSFYQLSESLNPEKTEQLAEMYKKDLGERISIFENRIAAIESKNIYGYGVGPDDRLVLIEDGINLNQTTMAGDFLDMASEDLQLLRGRSLGSAYEDVELEVLQKKIESNLSYLERLLKEKGL